MIDDKVKRFRRFEYSSNNPVFVLRTEECYTIVVDETKIIYLWKGLKSGSRERFIGSRYAKVIRDQVGADYNIIPLDEGQEDSGFLKLFKKVT